MSNDTTVWFHSMADLRNQFNRAGNYFFSRDTLRFFCSKVYDTLYGGRVFVTSEKQEDHPRSYTVRVAEIDENGYSVASLGFRAVASSPNAHRIAAEVGTLATAGLLPDVFAYGQDVALAHYMGINDDHADDGWVFDREFGFRRN